jgi:hypothetical protein
MTSECDDEIVEEIRRRRQSHAAAFDFDPKRIAEDFRRLERESGDPVVVRPPREPRFTPRKPSS